MDILGEMLEKLLPPEEVLEIDGVHETGRTGEIGFGFGIGFGITGGEPQAPIPRRHRIRLVVLDARLLVPPLLLGLLTARPAKYPPSPSPTTFKHVSNTSPAVASFLTILVTPCIIPLGL